MVVDTHLYDILGVDAEASDQDLKRAFRKKAVECHPDRNPDDPDATEKFQQLSEAYDILKDSEKRRVYDQFGAEGLRHEGGGGSFDDVLRHLFNIAPERAANRPRTRDTHYELTVTLEELYNGAIKTITNSRRIPCYTCKGSGCKPGTSPHSCEHCNGQGQVLAMQSVPGGYVRTIVPCPGCEGRGQSITDEDKCPECSGDYLIVENKEWEVHIDPGMESGDKIVFQGGSDEVPDADTGNLVVVVTEESHSHFERRHSDLLYTKTINLSEALFGANFVIVHLDNRQVIVKTDPSAIIQPSEVQVIRNEGMPMRGEPFQRGNLFVKYEIEFPDAENLTPELRAAIIKVSPMIDGAHGLDMEAEDVVSVSPEPAELDEFLEAKRADREHRNEAYRSDGGDSDDDEGGEQVGCAPM
jgi:DnaJ-class molecular chaperone